MMFIYHYISDSYIDVTLINHIVNMSSDQSIVDQSDTDHSDSTYEMIIAMVNQVLDDGIDIAARLSTEQSSTDQCLRQQPEQPNEDQRRRQQPDRAITYQHRRQQSDITFDMIVTMASQNLDYEIDIDAVDTFYTKLSPDQMDLFDDTLKAIHEDGIDVANIPVIMSAKYCNLKESMRRRQNGEKDLHLSTKPHAIIITPTLRIVEVSDLYDIARHKDKPKRREIIDAFNAKYPDLPEHPWQRFRPPPIKPKPVAPYEIIFIICSMCDAVNNAFKSLCDKYDHMLKNAHKISISRAASTNLLWGDDADYESISSAAGNQSWSSVAGKKQLCASNKDKTPYTPGQLFRLVMWVILKDRVESVLYIMNDRIEHLTGKLFSKYKSILATSSTEVLRIMMRIIDDKVLSKRHTLAEENNTLVDKIDGPNRPQNAPDFNAYMMTVQNKLMTYANDFYMGVMQVNISEMKRYIVDCDDIPPDIDELDKYINRTFISDEIRKDERNRSLFREWYDAGIAKIAMECALGLP